MSARTDGGNVTRPVPTQEIAARALTIVEREGVSIKTAISRIASGYDYKIRGSIHAYSFETIKRLNAIDHFIKSVVSNFEGIDPFIRNLLRIAVYEMKYKGVHPALATDSAVRIARKRKKRFTALVNAVLRRIERLRLPETDDDVGSLSMKYFHPEWFVSYTIELLGREEAIRLMEANLRTQPTYVRVNELKSSIESIVKYLENKGVELRPTFMDEVFRVERYDRHPASLDWHAEGKYVIQDLASCFVSHALDPSPGDTVVDLAAAPGMKTSHIAMLMENEGKIVAIDNSPERVERMKNKMRLLGVKNVEVKLGDGCTLSFEADKVLVDAPCSSTGSYATHPNVKWSFDPVKFRGTIAVQKKMLKNAISGSAEVVYSTCSILFEENEMNVMGFEVLPLNSPFARGIEEFRGKRFEAWDRVVRSYPHLHDCSGFFIAKLRGGL